MILTFYRDINSMSDCIFCKIINNELPSKKVFEDENTLAFRDVTPKAPHHILVIPREHYAGIHEIPSEKMDIMDRVFSTVKQVVKQEKLTENGYRLIVNFGPDSNQIVPHIHVHILAGRKMHGLVPEE